MTEPKKDTNDDEDFFSEEEEKQFWLDIYFRCGGDGQMTVYYMEGIWIHPDGSLYEDK